MTQHHLTPDDGTLEVRTYREGIAAKVGHDLIIDVTEWQADLALDGAASSLIFTADSGSLEVREGHNGAKALSDKDRVEIRKNIDNKVLRKQPIGFRSTSISNGGPTLDVEGELTIGSTTRPVSFELVLGENGRVSGTVPLVQREFGIKPYTALMGALKVRDDVEIVIDAQLG